MLAICDGNMTIENESIFTQFYYAIADVNTLQGLVILLCAFARVRQYHCSTPRRCWLLSIICYLLVCRGTVQLYALAIWCGLCFPVFPPRHDDQFLPEDRSRACRTSATGQVRVPALMRAKRPSACKNDECLGAQTKWITAGDTGENAVCPEA